MITDEKIIEAMAMLEMPTLNRVFWSAHTKGYRGQGPQGYSEIDNYLEDHNAVQRVIDNLDDESIDSIMCELEKITTGPKKLMGGMESNARMMKATARQKCQAILVVFGKWIVKSND
jgi:hypothetical protein